MPFHTRWFVWNFNFYIGRGGGGRYIHAYRYSNILTYRFSIWKVISSDCLWRLEHFYHCNSVETCVKVQGCATITKYSFSDAPKKKRLEEKTTTKQTATHETLDARSKNNCNRGTVSRKAIWRLCIILLAQTFTLNSDVQTYVCVHVLYPIIETSMKHILSQKLWWKKSKLNIGLELYSDIVYKFSAEKFIYLQEKKL